MEEKKQAKSENKGANKEDAKRLLNKERWKLISSYAEQQAKEYLFAERNALIEEKAKNELLTREIELLKKKDEVKNMYAGYNPEVSNTDKIVFILRRFSKLMITQELERELLICEPKLAQIWINPLSSVSAIVYRAVKIEVLIRYKKSGAYGFTYGLPEWFDDNNNLIKKFFR